MGRALGWLRFEPEVEEPPARTGRDWLLAAAVAGGALLEVIWRNDGARGLVALAFGLLLAATMLWRRTHPLATVALAFGGLVVLDVGSVIVSGQPFSLYAGTSVLALVYSLFRWGTTRQAAIGLAIVVVEVVVVAITDFTGLTDFIGGLLVLLFPGALGVSIRYRQLVHSQHIERARSQERETLARELHDTVAHHVSAIAIQAQAGRFLATTDNLAGAADALGVIEREASSTLAEMRTVVGSLRRDERAEFGPGARGVSDIAALAPVERSHGIPVEVEQRGDLVGLRPPIESALYRVAQEAITNAQRHARRASRIHVLLCGDDQAIRLRISDDGEPSAATPTPSGYGLVGMAERVDLLGGTVSAGPAPQRGWVVDAMIPRRGSNP